MGRLANVRNFRARQASYVALLAN